jgi:hypothetical protein
MKKAILFLLLLSTIGCHRIEVNAKVLSHELVSDQRGERIYITIVKTEDGRYKELTGLNYYVVPVGGNVRFAEIR